VFFRFYQAASGQAHSSMTERGSDSGAIDVVVHAGLLVSLVRSDLRPQGVAHLVAGGHRRYFFPHAVLLLLEEASSRFMDSGNNLLCDAHFFLFASGHIVNRCKAVKHLLEVSVARVVGAGPGLAAENVGFGGFLDPKDNNR